MVRCALERRKKSHRRSFPIVPATLFCSALCLYLAVPAQGSIIHYLPLDGPAPVDVIAGTTVTNFDAVPTADRNGAADSAYEFNGLTDYIHAEINVNPSTLPQMTWGAWVRSDIAHTTATSNVRAIASHDNGGFDRQFGIDHRVGNEISAFKGNGVLGGYPQSAGVWYFVAVTYDEPTQDIKLYVAAQGDTSQTGFTVISGTLAVVDDGHDYIYLGENTYTPVNEYWDGAIDNFFIDNQVLNLDALADIATNGIAIPEPSTWAILLLGGSCLAGFRVRRKRP